MLSAVVLPDFQAGVGGTVEEHGAGCKCCKHSPCDRVVETEATRPMAIVASGLEAPVSFATDFSHISNPSTDLAIWISQAMADISNVLETPSSRFSILDIKPALGGSATNAVTKNSPSNFIVVLSCSSPVCLSAGVSSV